MKKLIFLIAIPCVCLAAGPSAKDVQEYVKLVDAATKGNDVALKNGDLASLRNQSREMEKIEELGQQFGESIFSKPYGRCVKLGADAQELWAARLAASRTGDSSKAGRVTRAQENFQSSRKECLSAAK